MNKKILMLAMAVCLIAAGFVFNTANAGDHSGNTDKPWICHPVNGKGELGNGWNLIDPDHASSHIDESLYPDGHYWKHESKDGLRHDQYAVNGTCPGEPVNDDACPNLEGDQAADFPCSMEPDVSDADNIEQSCALGGTNVWSTTTTVTYQFIEGVWTAQAPVVENSPKQFTAWSPAELQAHGCTKEHPPVLHDGEIVVKHHHKHHNAPAVVLPNTGA